MSKQVLKSIFLFTAISFAERGVNYLITLGLSVYLPPEELGKLAYVLTVQAYLYPLIICYTNGSILIHYSKEADTKNYLYQAGVVNITSFLIILLLTCVVGILIDLSFLLIMIGLLTISLLESLRLNYLSFSQATLNIKRYAVVAIFFVVTNLAITFFFLMVYAARYEYRVYAILLSSLLTSGLIFWYLKRDIHFQYDRKYINEILQYGLPLLPHAFGLLAIESLNRYFLDSYGSKYELGLYSFAFTLASPLGILNTAFITGWSPHLYRLFQEDTISAKTKIVKVHTLYILFIVLIATLLSVFAKHIVQIFSIKYTGAYTYLMVIPFYFGIQAFYVIFSATLFFFKKNKYFIYLSIINIIASVSINYFLFNKYGTAATAWCSILSLTIFTLLVIFLSQKVYALPWMAMAGIKRSSSKCES